jgi:hypothetical protein
VQVIVDLDGRVADVDDSVKGARHDATAFIISGIAGRWASQPSTARHGRRRGHQGTGPITLRK